MKHHAKVATALSALAVLPLVRQDTDRDLLESAYADIVGSLEVMQRIEERVEQDPSGTRALLLDVTEPQKMPLEELDGRLDGLRREVSLLRMELDARQGTEGLERATPPAPRTTRTTNDGTPIQRPQISRTTPPGSPGHGLSDDLRNALRTNLDPNRSLLHRPGNADALPTNRLTGSVASNAPAASGPEPAGYSADPLGQARASVLARRYADALPLLEGRTDLASRYLRSRCLTELDRFDEAIALLEKILASHPESYEARRAAVDLEFARWKQEFMGNLPKGMRRTAAGSSTDTESDR